MLSPYIKNLAKELGKPESEVEKLWQTAKRHVSEESGKDEKDFGATEFALASETIRGLSQVREEVLNPDHFISSSMHAREFIETLSSSSFPSLDKNLIPPEEEEEDEEDVETLDIQKESARQATEVVTDEDWGDALDQMLEMQ